MISIQSVHRADVIGYTTDNRLSDKPPVFLPRAIKKEAFYRTDTGDIIKVRDVAQNGWVHAYIAGIDSWHCSVFYRAIVAEATEKEFTCQARERLQEDIRQVATQFLGVFEGDLQATIKYLKSTFGPKKPRKGS